MADTPDVAYDMCNTVAPNCYYGGENSETIDGRVFTTSWTTISNGQSSGNTNVKLENISVDGLEKSGIETSVNEGNYSWTLGTTIPGYSQNFTVEGVATNSGDTGRIEQSFGTRIERNVTRRTNGDLGAYEEDLLEEADYDENSVRPIDVSRTYGGGRYDLGRDYTVSGGSVSVSETGGGRSG